VIQVFTSLAQIRPMNMEGQSRVQNYIICVRHLWMMRKPIIP